MRKFRRIFRRLLDPRAANAQHNLLELLVIALAAMLCGAEGCSDMADFGDAKEGALRTLLRLEHGIPSHDTFSRVFRLLAASLRRISRRSHGASANKLMSAPSAFEIAAALERCIEAVQRAGIGRPAGSAICCRWMAASYR